MDQLEIPQDIFHQVLDHFVRPVDVLHDFSRELLGIFPGIALGMLNEIGGRFDRAKTLERRARQKESLN
jgi:hypothetical protein